MQSQHTFVHLSLLLHQSWNRISILSLLNLTWLSIIGPLYHCVSLEDNTKKMKRGHVSWTRWESRERVVAGGPGSHHMWLPLPGRPPWWRSWRFSHRVHKAHEPPAGIPHPSVGSSLQGHRQRKQLITNSQKHNISTDKTTMKVKTYRQTRAPYKGQTLQIYSPP